ncbi:hypothetical protein SORBI_3001G200300 [Sorghum bicolor]|uniref:Uncharacterized protein n=1 Tax=Sorghum bicolor TaxID=4558 RepID=C5WWB6_SORBI|nr:hypothetical protein SORBI_3001G200300 [Sorghum bicolor]
MFFVVGEVKDRQICTCGGQWHVPGVTSVGKGLVSFLLRIGAAEVLRVGEVEDGRIRARGRQGCVLVVASGEKSRFSFFFIQGWAKSDSHLYFFLVHVKDERRRVQRTSVRSLAPGSDVRALAVPFVFFSFIHVNNLFLKNIPLSLTRVKNASYIYIFFYLVLTCGVE